MTRYRYLIAAVLSVVVLALVVVRYWPERTVSTARPAVAGLTAAEQAARREAASRLARMAPASTRDRVGKFSAETIQTTEDKFRRMIAVRGLITQEKERRALAQQVLAAPDGAELMRTILLDPEFARTAFDKFQAEARFYAITVLDEVARRGNVDFVEDVAAALGKQLAQGTGEIDRGRAEDLRGLATAIGRGLGSAGIQDVRSPALAKLGISQSMAPPVRQLYVEGLFYGVWKAESIEQAMAAIDHLQKTL
jgi:hypothetical protein